MVVGMEVAYVPYEFFKDGEVMGYDVDLTRKFAEKLGVKVTFVDTEWAGIIPALLAKKFDVIISGMTITAERAQKVNFSMPYAEATSVVLARADDDSIKTAEDMAASAWARSSAAPPTRSPSNSKRRSRPRASPVIPTTSSTTTTPRLMSISPTSGSTASSTRCRACKSSSRKPPASTRL